MAKSKTKKPIPFDFVLDELYSVQPVIKPMFGCQAIYVQNKIVLILRNRSDHRVDNGVWIATDYQHHRSLRNEFPTMRAIELFGKNGSAWQNLPSNAIDFEEAVISACRLIMKGDLRIGKTPKAKKRKGNT